MQYMTGNFIRRLIGLGDVSRHDSMLEERWIRLWTEILSGLLHDVYTWRSSRQSVATADAALMRQRYRPVSHELNMTPTVAPITQIETNHID